MAGRQAAPGGAWRGHQAKPHAARGGRGRGRGRGRGGGRGRGAGRGDGDLANNTAAKTKSNATRRKKSPFYVGQDEDSSAFSATASTASTAPGIGANSRQQIQLVASVSISNSLNQFANHMQTINEAIGDAMPSPSSSPQSSAAAANAANVQIGKHKQQQCPACIQTTQKLQTLQSQTTIGLNCLEQMATALEQLLVKARLATSALEQMQIDVNDATALMVQDELNANGSPQAMNGNAGGGIDNNGSAKPRSQPTSSSVSNQNNVIPGGPSSRTTTNNNIPSVWAVDESTSNYHQPQTIASQTTFPKLSTTRSKATPSSTTSSHHTPSSQLSSSTTTTTTNQTSTTATERERLECERAEVERLERENGKRQAEIEREQERAREEHKRMLAQQTEAERARMAHQARLDAEEADRGNERKREELRARDMAREEQKRLANEARLAKAAEKARQEELEREDAEEERRRLEHEKKGEMIALEWHGTTISVKAPSVSSLSSATPSKAAEKARQEELERGRLEHEKKEKMVALEWHGTTISVKAPSVSSLSSATPSFQPKIPKGVVSIGASSSNQNAKQVAAGMKKSKNSSSKSITTSSAQVTKAKRKPAFVRKTNRLSYYIKNCQDNAHNISPVFSLLQNEETLERGRKLLLLECQAKEHRSLLDELIKKRASDEAVLNKITSEEESFVEFWKTREPSLKKRIDLEREKIKEILIEAGLSKKQREEDDTFREKKKKRSGGMSELQGRINAIERGISNKTHADTIDQLKVSSKKLNEALAKIETQSSWSLLSQDKNEVILYEKEVYAHLRELGIDTEAGHWKLGKVGDQFGKELMKTTKKRERCMSIINGLRGTIDKKRDALQTLYDNRLEQMDKISAAKKKIEDESKWSTKVEKMREGTNCLHKEVERIEDSNDDVSGKLLDCVKSLEGLLADDGVYWTEKEKKIKETIAGLKKEAKEGEEPKNEEDSAAGVIRLIKAIEKEMKDGNAKGELSAAKKIIELEIKDIEEKMQQSKKGTGIFAKVKRLLTDDERTKLEKRKKHLVEQAKACTDLIEARKTKANIEEKRQYINEEITQSQEKLRQVETDVASLNDEIFSHVKTFSAITNEIDWEAAAKSFVIALYSKIRELQEKLDKDKAEDLRLEEAYQQTLQDEGRDEKTKQTKIQAMQRDITGCEREAVAGAQRVKEGPGKIGDQREVVDANSPKINAVKKQLNECLHDITNLKPPGSVDDQSFHIDETRDTRGHTFLMVASTNDDVETAQMCLDWGASPHAVNPEGLTAIDYSYFFGFDRITKLILEHRGSLPQKQVDAMSRLRMSDKVNTEINWTESLKVAETASIPAETLAERPEELEQDENKRMAVLSETDRLSTDFTCFEARLLDENIASDRVHRVVFLNGEVYNYLLTCDLATASNFIGVLEGLKPARVRKAGVKPTKIHRRSCVGTAGFEVIAASFRESNGFEKDALLTPFVSGEIEGVAQIGVIVWAICPDNEASLYKTLISSTEFMRHKVEMDDRFLPHKSSVLEIGRDMHLLDLHSTSIWTTSTMDLFILNVDEGDLDRIQDPGFSAKKRIVYSEQIVNRAIFRAASETEAKEDEGILATETADKSTVISGGAGTGKTLLMIKKVSKEDPSLRILVVSRLPRLVNIVKAAVESSEDRSCDGAANVSFTTYDELFQVLARRVVPDEDQDYKSFARFDHVRYDCDEDSGVSFLEKFVNPLGERTKKQMAVADVEPLTLWFAIITVKTHARCVATKMPLTLDEYLLLPRTFGMTGGQRQLCYELFTKYQEWCAGGSYWDEADRSLYIVKYGPSVYRDKTFVPWAERVNQRGETNLLDEEGNPLYPFFADLVAADEAQDFTELDIAIFVRMSSLRSCFINTDPAQSVEVGVKLREGTVNDVFYSQINKKGVGVKDVLQSISLKTNHRTHAQNLALGTAIRRTLARSFKLPIVEENALINGKLPSLLRIEKLEDLADSSKFKGANIVFLCPDAMVHNIRSLFREQNLQNDVFGVVEAKGLEFDSCALLNFFGFFEEKGNADQWMNCLRWLSSSAGITNTSPTNEWISGKYLEDCDYIITHPEVSDQAMMLYTALTRARNQLIIIEADVVHTAKSKKSKGRVKLADFAYRRFTELSLAKTVSLIDEGQIEMSPAQHKARGVLLVTQAISMIAAHEPFDIVRKKFLEAEARFAPSTGNDIDLLKKCKRHLKALETKRELVRYARTNFFVKGKYNLEGKFAEVLFFGQSLGDFFSKFAGDSFLQDEVKDVKSLVEEIFASTPYEFRFRHLYEA